LTETKPLPRLEISVTALIQEPTRASVGAYLTDTLFAATIGIAVRDPEKPSRCNMRIMPGSRGDTDLFARQLDLLRRSSLVTPATADSASALSQKLRGLTHQAGYSFSRAAELALDRTPMQPGQLFCILDLVGINDALPKCLARFPGGCGITPATCRAFYRDGPLGWRDMWSFGSLSKAGEASVLERVDDMTSRGKVTAETGRMFAEWIKETSVQVERLPALPVSRAGK